MQIGLISIFPEIFTDFVKTSLIGKGVSAGALTFHIVDPRKHTPPPHARVDDTPYGGGAGMVMKAEPVLASIRELKTKLPAAKTILLTPRGKSFTQADAKRLATEEKQLIFICARYEGLDERICELGPVDYSFSIGDAITMGGEAPAMVAIEAITRLIPSIVGNEESLKEESFATNLLEYPHYTKPGVVEGVPIPSALLSGNHAEVRSWRQNASLKTTAKFRPERLLPDELATTAQPTFVALLHEGMLDKTGKGITTSLTLIDMHDFARSGRTFGVQTTFIVHPYATMRDLAGKVAAHWGSESGINYNPDRSHAFEAVSIVDTLDVAIKSITSHVGAKPIIFATSAKESTEKNIAPPTISYTRGRAIIAEGVAPNLILFGTGYGMGPELLSRANYLLEPIIGPTQYNHLSVRVAAGIILSRLLG